MTDRVEYTPELVEDLCAWIGEGIHVAADGKETFCSLRAWCRQPGRPTFSAVYKWIRKNPEIAREMQVARETGAEAIAEQCIEIIDTLAEVESTQFGSKRDAAHVAWLKNRVYVRMELLKKWHPKVYGEKLQVDGKVEHQHAFAEQLDAARLRAHERTRAEDVKH